MKRFTRQLTLTLCLTLAALSVHGADWYWDLNGATTGAGGATPAGDWSIAAANWNADLLGEGTGTVVWDPLNTAVFSAGSDAIGVFTINVPAAINAAGIIVEEGSVSLSGSAVTLGTGSITVGNGAFFSIAGSTAISMTAGSVLTLDGGTMQNRATGNAGSFIDVDTTITLGANGGTFYFNTPSIMSIVQTASIISGPGSLTKTGVGILAIASPSTYLGDTIINEGELRIRSAANRIPIGTAVTVNNPGILNLNGVNQQIGSLSGNGRVGLANATLTIGGSANSTFSGTIEDTANAGASGSTALGGKLTKLGSGVQTLTGNNTYTGATTVNEGTLTLSGGGAIPNSPTISIGSGGTFDVSGVSGGNFSLGGGQTLTGSGTMVGNVLANGPVRPGTSIGTLTINGNLTLAGTTTMELDRSASPQLADLISATSIAFGGQLVVTNIGATLLYGDSFDLFDGVLSGSFGGGIELPLVDGLSWDISGLNAGGSGLIQVIPEPSTFALGLLGGLGLMFLVMQNRRE